MNLDRIERSIVLRASQSRVWRALTNADEFGTGFGVKLSGTFTPGSRLAEVANGIQLTVVESGFDRIPLERRAEAFRMNDHGWAAQLGNIERHVAA